MDDLDLPEANREGRVGKWVLIPISTGFARGALVCHDRGMRVVGFDSAHRHRTTLFRRLFLTYAAVVGLAVAVLVLAPITVSVPTALAELAVLLAGFAVTLVIFLAFLRRRAGAAARP